MWLLTTTWLLVAKVLPPLLVGEPPNYRTIISADQRKPRPPVWWSIRWNDKPLGWAASDIVHSPDRMSEFHGRVFLRELPLVEMLPPLVNALVKPVFSSAEAVDLDARNRMNIDPLGRLSSFDTHVHIASIRDAIRIEGTVEGSKLKLMFRLGDLSEPSERYLPSDALVTDEFTPQAYLPGLRVGQTWTMPSYSPLRPTGDPMEILQATVERTEDILWDGNTVEAHLVVYRADPGAGLLTVGEPRGRLWVRADGLVMRQEISIMNTKLLFTRQSVEKCRRLAEVLDNNILADISPDKQRELRGVMRERPRRTVRSTDQY
jgi:hypothetical protein